MPVEQWIEKWKHKIIGVIVEGICTTDKEMKVRMICNLPGLVDSLLRQMRADVEAKVAQSNDKRNGPVNQPGRVGREP